MQVNEKRSVSTGSLKVALVSLQSLNLLLQEH